MFGLSRGADDPRGGLVARGARGAARGYGGDRSGGDVGRGRRPAARPSAPRQTPPRASDRARRSRGRLGTGPSDRNAHRSRRPRRASVDDRAGGRGDRAGQTARLWRGRHRGRGRHVRARHGQNGRGRAELFLRHRPDRALRREPPRPRRLRRAPDRLHPRDAEDGQDAVRGHRRRLRLSHRSASAPRPVGHAGLHRDGACRKLLRELSAAPGSAPPTSRPARARAPSMRDGSFSNACALSSGGGIWISRRSRTPTTCGCASARTRA